MRMDPTIEPLTNTLYILKLEPDKAELVSLMRNFWSIDQTISIDLSASTVPSKIPSSVCVSKSTLPTTWLEWDPQRQALRLKSPAGWL